ncbi:hypothetical protein [Candidatus Electronema sp. TJ]|uniref:hypothetical protein n=1 Tax=Candidatus Electronema sp. TJ TaxID=3401573 RepID=UPI003AA8B6E2
MKEISLTTFVDIVVASGISRSTKARAALKDEKYHPAKDFYKPLRERIEEYHRRKIGKEYLLSFTSQLTDRKKEGNYSVLVDNYCKWIGRKEIEYFEPIHAKYGKENVAIRVNPELGLAIGEKRCLVKLYFKSEQLSKNKADIILGLMQTSLQREYTMSVLDIRQRKLFTPTIEIPMLKEIVDAELSYISAFLHKQ